MQVTPGKTVSALCASVWDGGWCKIRFKEEAGIIRAVGTVTKKNGQDEWDIKFPFADSPVDHTIYEFLLRIEDPLQKADVNETDSKVKTPVRKGVNFKTNSDRIRQILSAATLNDETKVLQVADTLKAMYPAASMHALIREHFDHSSGYVAQGSTVPLKASAMASALVMRHASWDAIIEAETGSKPSNPKPSNGGDPFNEALAQENSDLQGEVARLRNQKEQLERSAKRLKTNDGGLRCIQLHLDEDDEIVLQQEQRGTSGLRHALAKLADDEADRAKILDKYGLRTIPEVHLCDTKTLRRIMKGYGVSVTELLPAKGVAECGQETRTSAKGAMTSELSHDFYERFAASLGPSTLSTKTTSWSTGRNGLSRFDARFLWESGRDDTSRCDWAHSCSCVLPTKTRTRSLATNRSLSLAKTRPVNNGVWDTAHGDRNAASSMSAPSVLVWSTSKLGAPRKISGPSDSLCLNNHKNKNGEYQ
eukprot:g9585.t1